MGAVLAVEFFMGNDLKACVTTAPQFMIEGVKFVRQGKPSQAIVDFNIALADGYNNRGEAYAQQGRWNEALADYNMAITLNPNDSRPYGGRGQYFMLKGKYDEAAAEFTKVVAIHDDFSQWILPQLAWIHFMRGDSDLAYKDYSYLLSKFPMSSKYLTLRGVVSYDRKDFDHAMADFNAILAVNHNDASAYLGRSLVYAAKGETDLARQELDTARSLNIGLGEVCMSWASAFESSGFSGKAKEYMHFAILINPQLKEKYAALVKELS